MDIRVSCLTPPQVASPNTTKLEGLPECIKISTAKNKFAFSRDRRRLSELRPIYNQSVGYDLPSDFQISKTLTSPGNVKFGGTGNRFAYHPSSRK